MALWEDLRKEKNLRAADVLRVLNIYMPPIDPDAIALKLGCFAVSLQEEGESTLDASKPVPIYISRKNPLRRIQGAQLLAHLLLHRLRDFSQEPPSQFETFQAEAFAMELVAPDFLMAVSLHYGPVAPNYLGLPEDLYRKRYNQLYKRG